MGRGLASREGQTLTTECSLQRGIDGYVAIPSGVFTRSCEVSK